MFSPQKHMRTVAEGIELWLAAKKARSAKSSYRSYKTKAQKIIDTFGDRPISEVSKTEIEAFQAKLVEVDKLSTKYVNDVFTPLRGVWRDAYIDELIPRDFMPLITNFDTSEKESEPFPFTLDEQQRIGSTPTRFRSEVNAVLFNCWVGLSASELLALAWEDIDMKRWTARVRRAYVDYAYKIPKEKYRARTVEILHPARRWLVAQMEVSAALPPVTVQVKQRDNVSTKEEDVRLVFVNTATQTVWSGPDNFSKRFLRAHLRKAKVPYRSLNQTRHTFASQMLTNYISKDWIINQLGHRDYTMLYKHYARFIPEDTPLLADIVAQQLGLDTGQADSEMVQWRSKGKNQSDK
jgi:integrase